MDFKHNGSDLSCKILLMLMGMLGQLLTTAGVPNSGKGFAFTTCVNTGRFGPTQYQCDNAYKQTQVNVTVLDEKSDPPIPGVQVWLVPEDAEFSITALGAGGGAGVRNPVGANGAYVHAKFNFTKGEKIYLLIGQSGSSACPQSKNPICRNGTQSQESKNMLGGGGGGGATFIFKYDEVTEEIIPLIVAAGGGGKSFHQGRDLVKAEGGYGSDGNSRAAYTPTNGSGGGGGLHTLITNPLQQAGRSLDQRDPEGLRKNGGIGGEPCPRAARSGWEISGGFGGGGGGCSSGGGGGGFSGGNVSSTDDPELNGQGGRNYIHPNGTSKRVEPGANTGPQGEVEIAFVLDCPCEFMCIFKDYHNQLFTCYCAPNYVLADDGLRCIDPNELDSKEEKPSSPTRLELGIASGCFIVVIGFILYCGFYLNHTKLKDTTVTAFGLVGAISVVFVGLVAFLATLCIIQQKQKRQAIRFDAQKSDADCQLDRLRSTNTTSTMMTEYNPNYDFGDAKYTIQDLREIPRDKLSFVKALGQGAFGEVYQGILTNVPEEPPTLPVAVKTLPALCTDQAEMDFLMEALIMSKFSHPNIVRFIGVCFEKHPRYIILELLEGGDLKTFLRESRPKPGRPSRVTMLDLVKLSLDVAKGCQYLEENRFIHRDIAARNCLLTTKNSSRIAKIADFGMARDIYRADYYRKGGKAMLPVKWMPPEAFLDGFFSSKTDVWSFGILLWEVFSMGYMPYPGCGNQEVMQLVTAGGRLEPPSNCPKPIYQIMKICSHGVPERRPNFATIIEKLQQCLQDPDVVHSPLPVFQHPATVARHNSVGGQPDHHGRNSANSDSSYLEPDTPSSLQPLIGPQSPTVDISIEQETVFHDSKTDRARGARHMFTYNDSFDENEEQEHMEPLMNHIEPAGMVSEPVTQGLSGGNEKHSVMTSEIDRSFERGVERCDSFLIANGNCSNQASQLNGSPKYSNVSHVSASEASNLENSPEDAGNSSKLSVEYSSVSSHGLSSNGKSSNAIHSSEGSIRAPTTPPKFIFPPVNSMNPDLPPIRAMTEKPLKANASVQSLPPPDPPNATTDSYKEPLSGHQYVNTQFGNNKSMSTLSQYNKSNQNGLMQNELPSRSAVSLENSLEAADRQL